MNKIIRIFIFLFCLSGVVAQAQTPIALEHGAHRTGKRTDADMQHWREYGFGQFIHWGVYAIPGGHWNGKCYDGAAEWIRSWNEMSVTAYDSLYTQFNPQSFDADHWAEMARNMGAKYLIITTKHHDGFCLWPSKFTNYSIKNTPYRKNILKQLVDAYNLRGIDVYLYFSIIDWNHPGYRSSLKSKQDSIAYEGFKQFTRNQLIELLTDYPAVKGFWFDGTWDKAWVNQSKFADELDAELRALHPGLIFGSRFRADELGKRGSDSNGRLMGDYEQGWERDLPNSMEDVHGNDWECVMTIPENQWGYHSEWKGYVKSSFNLIEILVKSVSMNGNFVLNFGPDGNGNIRPQETQIAKEIGEWMKVNNQAVYGCTFAGLKKQDWGYYTRKKDSIYLTVVNKPLNNRLCVEIPKAGFKPVKACLLANKKPVEIIDGGRTKQNNRLYYIAVPDGFKSNLPFVIVLEVDNRK